MNVTLLGAGGKMGGRLIANLRPRSEYSIDYVEISDMGRKRLAEQKIEPVEVGQAISRAEVVILAIPDASIGKVTDQIVPMLRPRTMIFGLDPAAAYAEVMIMREDLTYFVAHPCHPPLFSDSAPADSESDWFGGRSTLAQSVVCALHHGPEEDYPIGEKLAADMFAPILRLHRITVEQMAILEPAALNLLC
jgi:prephenate dehydrogenase